MKDTKIAIVEFNKRIAPRFGCSENLFIYTVDKDKNIKMDEKIKTINLTGFQIADILINREIKVLICGGINERFLVFLKENKIKTIWGIIGNVDKVINLFLHNELKTNNNFCYRNRNRYRHGRRCPKNFIKGGG